MDGMVFLLILIIIALIVLPLIIYSKVNSIKNDIEYFNRNITDLDRKLSKLLNRAVTKDDMQEIADNINELKNKIDKVQAQPIDEKNPYMDEIIPDALSKEDEKIIEKFIEETSAANTPIIKDIEEEPGLIQNEIPENPISQEPIPESIMPLEQSEPVEIISTPIVQEERVLQNNPVEVDDRNFVEKLLGDNWLSKVGIITLVLGIAFFVKYAIDQDWINEVGRVGIGLLTGGIIIGIAHKLKNKYHVFSSILVGGGISVLYITITLAFREYELFNQTLAFILLIGVTLFSVILSWLYDRKELAIFSLLGGFASPLMVSSGAGNYVVLFSYILILNTGMLSVSFMKKWRVIGIISYVLSLLFFWSWLLVSFQEQYISVTCFAVLFFLQFYLLAIIDHFKTEKKVTAWQAVLILTNNLFLFLACLYIYEDYTQNVRGIVTIAIALLNAVIMLTLFRKSKVDRTLIYLIIAVVMTFVSLAIPIQLNGHAITMFWAAETVILLLLWQKSHIKVFRTGFLIICGLTVVSYLMDLNSNYSYNDSLSIIFNRIFITGIIMIVAFTINSYLLGKEQLDSHENTGGFPFSSIIKIFRILLITLIFIVPFLEINYQLEKYTDVDYISDFRYNVLAVYTVLYIAVLAFIYRQRLTKQSTGSLIFRLLYFFIILFILTFSFLTTGLRYHVFVSDAYSTSHFLIHFLALPAIAYIIFLLIKNIRKVLPNLFNVFCWTMVIASVILLSIETDNIMILLFGNEENYDSLLYDIHTFGYPILWGIIAMILMIWGLNRKEVLLRKISLIFFGLIIVKFYAYDVWHMSQTGRIVSFVLLGVILLLVSFLQQKIKTLVKEDEEKSEQQL